MEPQSPVSVVSLRDRWNSVQSVRLEFASELDQLADDLPTNESSRLKAVVGWFNGPAELDDALRRPNVIASCLSLIKSSTGAPFSSTDIARAARVGVCSVRQNSSASRKLIRALTYPACILLAALLMGVAFSFWIAPMFDDMFNEFGIELPSATKGLLWIAQLVRQLWWVVIALPIGLVLAISIINRPWGDSGVSITDWLDQRLTSTRVALASWAWHISLLLDVGLPQQDAFKHAGNGADQAWLRQFSLGWAEDPHHELANEEEYFFSPRFQLLNRVMKLPPSAGKIAMLQEVAVYYWDRNRLIGDWWVQWLVCVLLWMIGAAVLLTVVSLFAPMIAIISGLTGHG